MLGAIAATNTDVVVFSVAAGSAADMAGIKPNMIVTTVDGQPMSSAGQLNDYLSAHANQNVTIAGLLG